MKNKSSNTVINFGLFGGLIFAIFFVAICCLIATGFFVYLTFLVAGTLIVWSYGHIHKWMFPRKPKNFTFNPSRY